MRFTLRGKIFESSKEEVEKKLAKVKPEVIARNKYYIQIGEREYPIKQVVSEVFELARMNIQSQDAYRVLRSLDFKIIEK